MPSPLAHALGGFAAGWLVAGPPAVEGGALPRQSGHGAATWRSPSARRALGFAALGVAADLDLLIGRHSQFTHSLGAALIVCVTAAVVLRARGRRWLLLALAAGAAYGIHVVLDWLGQDATPPFGITALWPFSRAYYISNLDVFWGISRQPWRPGAFGHDVTAIVREVAIMGPVAVAAWWTRRRRGWQVPPTAPRRGRQEVPGAPGPGGQGRKSSD